MARPIPERLLPLRPSPTPSSDPAVSGMALVCGVRIVYTSLAEPRGYDRPRRLHEVQRADAIGYSG